VNLRFNKSASLQQFLSHFALMMQRQCSDGIMISFCVNAALFLLYAFFCWHVKSLKQIRIEEVFWRIRSEIKSKRKQGYINNKASSV